MVLCQIFLRNFAGAEPSGTFYVFYRCIYGIWKMEILGTKRYMSIYCCNAQKQFLDFCYRNGNCIDNGGNPMQKGGLYSGSGDNAYFCNILFTATLLFSLIISLLSFDKRRLAQAASYYFALRMDS